MQIHTYKKHKFIPSEVSEWLKDNTKIERGYVGQGLGQN